MRCSPPSLLLLALLSLTISSCGGSSSGGTPVNSQSYPNLAGNWSIILIPGNPLVFGPILGGSMTNTSGSVTGTLHVNNSDCFQATQDVSVTGTVTPAGAVALTSAAVGGQTLSMTGYAAVNLGNGAAGGVTGIFNGSYAFSGGCANGENGTFAGTMMPPVDGVYAGSFQSVSGQNIGVSLNVTQAGPNADGEFSISGTATFTGSPCFSTAAIAASTIDGEFIDATVTGSNGTMEFTGEILDTVPTLIGGTYHVTAGACTGDTGGGNLTKS